MEYYSAIKMNEIVPYATIWMDVEINIVSEVSKTDKDKYHISHHLFVESKIKWYKWTHLQNRHRLTDLENELICYCIT